MGRTFGVSSLRPGGSCYPQAGCEFPVQYSRQSMWPPLEPQRYRGCVMAWSVRRYLLPFGFTGHRSLATGHYSLPSCDRQATGRGCSLSTTSVNRQVPPSMLRAEPGIDGLRAGAATGIEKSEKRGVQAARNGPSVDRKCWQRVELGIHGLNRWAVNCLEMSGKRGVQAARNGPSPPPCGSENGTQLESRTSCVPVSTPRPTRASRGAGAREEVR
jgi:hypothetical protein